MATPGQVTITADLRSEKSARWDLQSSKLVSRHQCCRAPGPPHPGPRYL